MSAARKIKTTGARKGMIAKIKIGQKQLGWSDEIYRDVLDVRYDKSSATQLTIAELEDLLDHLKRQGFKPTKKAPARAGRRPLADGEMQGKMRALWIALYHLGVVREPAEQALVNFAKRVTGGRERGVAALQWLDIEQSDKVIEALKAMANREAGVSWEPYRFVGMPPVYMPRHRVIEAQWRVLMDICPALSANQSLREYLKDSMFGEAILSQLTDEETDQAIENLGAQIRKSLGDHGCQTLKEWKAKS
ncbi:regulatory protein GemA [Magnetovibrio sp.]|uniref:regulatory protein GemA n=1 Tax=Magnetovibrio sp. TaxID=2024836 RepID=UPI002F91D3EB